MAKFNSVMFVASHKTAYCSIFVIYYICYICNIILFIHKWLQADTLGLQEIQYLFIEPVMPRAGVCMYIY